MRVLFLSHRIPYPPDKGDKVRAYHHLLAIAGEHEVDLFTLADQGSDLTYTKELDPYCRRITVSAIDPGWAKLRSLPSLLTRRPLTLPYFNSKELRMAVRQAIGERSYDLAFVYSSAMMQYVDQIEQIPIVTDLVDVDSSKWAQYALFRPFPFSAIYRREGRCLEEYEGRIVRASRRVIVSTDREAELARRISPGSKVDVIANGVDKDYFCPREGSASANRPWVIFTGDMSYFPNQVAVEYFAEEVLPLIRKRATEAGFMIVGRNPNLKVRRLARIPGVEVTGFVPDVRPYLAQARVSVAPFSIAAGIQNKILEAMAFGLPVVATSRARRGLADYVAEVVETGDSAEEMAGKVLALLKDSELAHRQGALGRQRVCATYDWRRTKEHLLKLIDETVAAEPRASVGSVGS